MSLQGPFKRIVSRFLPERMLQSFNRFREVGPVRPAREPAVPETRVVRHLVRPGSRVVDVGANAGSYTTFLAGLVGPFGKVFSIEAVPDAYEALAATIDRLGLINVQTFHLAVSAREGVAWVPLSNDDVADDFPEEPAYTRPCAVEVSARTLDGLFGPADRIEFVRCNVDGEERSAVVGAAELLRTTRPAWLLNISGNPDRLDTGTAYAFGVLTAHGYDSYRFADGLLSRRRAGERSPSYFFLTPAQAARLPRDLFEDSDGDTRRVA